MTQETSPQLAGRFVLGIDAGGTSVRAVLADAQTAKTIAETEASAVADGGPEVLADLLPSLLSLVGTHTSPIAVTAGITKFTRTGVADRWREALTRRFPPAVCSVVPDYVIAFHGAIPSGIGIVVIAGTGSVVYGEDRTGKAIRVGGRGWEYGDEGSGTYITTEAIRRTLRALDGLETPTPLTKKVCQVLDTEEPGLFAEWARQRAMSEGRGFLVPLLLEQARTGDTEAKNLFVGAAGWLAAWTRAAHRQLDFSPDSPVVVAGIGGLWTATDLLTVPFERVLHRWIPEAILQTPDSEPRQGAVRLACRSIDRASTSPYT